MSLYQRGLLAVLIGLFAFVFFPKATHHVNPDFSSIRTYGYVETENLFKNPQHPFLRVTEESFKNTERERVCLAKNIYYEARGEGEYGMYAVAQVTINRLKVGYWGNTVCKVVYAKSQFSWTLENNLKKPAGEMWDESLRIADNVLNGIQVRTLMTALFYHADYVKPNWRDENAKIKKVGAHIFYERARGSRLQISVDET
jgi:spore germination cell wall hydrolase CwlJ-like protein